MPRKTSTVTDIYDLIDSVLDRLSKKEPGLTIPIDLAEVCRMIGVGWELRWMVPEGVTGLVDGQLRIFLRNNFSEKGTPNRRQRFTWAHEICHVLLYDLRSDPIKLAPDAPKGASLEHLCQRGAGYLLMPTRSIQKYFSLAKPVSSVEDVVMLTKTFEVSYEVTVRRLKEIRECLRTNYALVLLRDQNGESYIEAAVHDVWLETVLSAPARGQKFAEWAKSFVDQSLQVGPDEWEKGRLSIRLKPLSRSLRIAEIKDKIG